MVVALFNDGIKAITGGFDLQASNPMQHCTYWAILLTGLSSGISCSGGCIGCCITRSALGVSQGTPLG
ncbi:MAG: hypothetical protein R2795_18630 [Saprospiraceae bacterium]